MLTLKVLLVEEYYDDEKEEFIDPVEVELELEHSLVSLSKWESKHEKPFLSKDKKTAEEILSYVECMIVSPFFSRDILDKLSQANFDEINKYIDAKMTATWFNEPKHSPPAREQITAELIYYWMVSYQIPWEAERWHLSRLFTLIKIFNIKSQKPKKMSRSEMAAQRRQLNEQRLAASGSSG